MRDVRSLLLAIGLTFITILGGAHAVMAQSIDPAEVKRAMDALNNGDFPAALAVLKPMADNGDPFAQFTMGQLAETGGGVPKNPREAARWYKLAVESGQTDAMTNLGFLYEQGRGVPQDYKEALRLYTAAATSGNPVAQTNLAIPISKARSSSRITPKPPRGTARPRPSTTPRPSSILPACTTRGVASTRTRRKP